MTAATLSRVSLIEEATAIEKAGGDWSVLHVLAVLDCHKATLYRNHWLMARSFRQPGGTAFHPSDVRLYQANNSGMVGRRRARRGA